MVSKYILAISIVTLVLSCRLRLVESEAHADDKAKIVHLLCQADVSSSDSFAVDLSEKTRKIFVSYRQDGELKNQPLWTVEANAVRLKKLGGDGSVITTIYKFDSSFQLTFSKQGISFSSSETNTSVSCSEKPMSLNFSSEEAAKRALES